MAAALCKVFECLLTFYPDLRQQHSAGRSAPTGLWHLWQCHMPTESPDTDSDGWQPHSEEESWEVREIQMKTTKVSSFKMQSTGNISDKIR